MEHAATLATLAAIHLAWNFGPGPNVVLVAHVAARESRAAGFSAALGWTAGAAAWATAAAIGLGVLSALEELQQILRIGGAAYLVYLGLSLWRNANAPGVGAAPLATATGWRAFRIGVLTNLANPISVVFFSGIFAAVLPPDLPLWVRAASVLVIVVDAMIWYGTMAAIFSVGAAQWRYRHARRWIDRVAGAAMIVFGARGADGTMKRRR